ncbi:MAG: acyl-protein synthetase [Verrucomicrobiota bacterium]
MSATLALLAAEVTAFIAATAPQTPPGRRLEAVEAERQFEQLALALHRFQAHHNPVVQALDRVRGMDPEDLTSWEQIPALPAVAFKDHRVSCLAETETPTVFHSSGTTTARPGRHFHSPASLAVYEASLRPWFEHHLLDDRDAPIGGGPPGPLDGLGFIFLTPPPAEAPHSSLVHMLETVRRACAAPDSLFVGRHDPAAGWVLDFDRLLFALRRSMCANRPVALVGTAFQFVHLLDHFTAGNRRYRLAPGSRAMETGGYKGRSRELPQAELHAALGPALGLPPGSIVTEYGMSELGSQAYDRRAGRPDDGPARLRFPPWARVRVVSPETGRRVPPGEAGIVQVFDLANVASAVAVETADLGRWHPDGLELLGRAASAEPRGCSLLAAARPA